MPNKQTSVLKRFVAVLMSGFSLFAKAFNETVNDLRLFYTSSRSKS